jgi:DNA polymerase elongation subunit (family B)
MSDRNERKRQDWLKFASNYCEDTRKLFNASGSAATVGFLAAKKAHFGILPNGEPEIKGLSIAKSNSPKFFRQTFRQCLAKLSEGRQSPSAFEQAKRQVPAVVEESIRQLREGKVNLSDLEYQVELRDDPEEKVKSRVLPQPYQVAMLLLNEGKKVRRGDSVSFVKVNPFKIQGKQFTVKPSSQAHSREINVNEYIHNLVSSLSQTFGPMNISLSAPENRLSKFV